MSVSNLYTFFNYVGTISGPFTTPKPISFTLIKDNINATVMMKVTSLQQFIVDVAGIGSLTFSPRIPPEFTPSIQSVGSLFIASNFGLPVNFGSSLLVIPTTGILIAYSFAGNFNIGDMVGLAPSASAFWELVI